MTNAFIQISGVFAELELRNPSGSKFSKVDFGPSHRFSPFQNLTPISAKESIKRKVKKCEVRNNQGKEKPRNQLISGFLVREAGLEVQIFHIWYSIYSILALFLLKTRNSGIIPSTSFQ